MARKHFEDKFLITLSDILKVFRLGSRRILWCVGLMGAAASLWALTRPIKYKAEGTFCEKNLKSSQVSIAQALLSDTFNIANSESTALSVFKSRKLMVEVIKRLNLQGRIDFDQSEGLFGHIKHNLQIEWSRLKRSPYPALNDVEAPLFLTDIHYSGEVPRMLRIEPTESNSFRVTENRVGKGIGQFGQLFSTGSVSFIIQKRDTEKPFTDKFTVILSPLKNLAQHYIENFEIKNMKADKNVLVLSYIDQDRHKASQFINAAMEVYQSFSVDEHDKMAAVQMNYLHQRQEESTQSLMGLMGEHASFLSSDLSSAGFIDSKREMDFLVKGRQELKEKLFANELEIKRLVNLQSNHYVHYDQYMNNEGNANGINKILTEIRDLKQQRDALELALRENVELNGNGLAQSFDRQLDELKQIERQKLDLKSIAGFHKSRGGFDLSSPLLQDSRYLVQGWVQRLYGPKIPEGEEWEKNSDQFIAYLDNTERLLNVHEKILMERLAHQQQASNEYHGINLRTANELYLEYCKKLSDEESLIRQTNFFMKQMDEDPDFEMTSLCSVLQDPVSSGMINKAADLLLRLKDESNQSGKEQVRLREDLALQRTFLTRHVSQMVQLMGLKKKLIGEKIYTLQNVSLELIHQQVSLLEKNLGDYIKSRLDNLEQEREIVRQHLKDIQSEMLNLPQKWMSERLIEEKVENNRIMVREIAKIVESKTISHNLDVIQSAPIDVALPPLHPESPHIILFTLLGAMFGSVFGSAFVLAKSLRKGLQVSSDTLRSMGVHVSGFISSSGNSPRADGDLETLRRLSSYFEEGRAKGAINGSRNAVLLLEGGGPEYSLDLAHLFSKAGKKVLVIDLDFDRSPGENSLGLLPYLEGQISTLPITSTVYGGYIPSGGTNRFAPELLGSDSFKKLLENLRPQYDWIIAVSRALPCTADAEALASLFSFTAITAHDENAESFSFYAGLAEDPEKRISFVVSL
jgi:tyrosine-protein kinase Etk/Wzc